MDIQKALKFLEEKKSENIKFVSKFELKEIAKVMQEYADQQLILSGVTFCLPIEGDTFVSWHSRHFKLQVDGSVVAIKNETIRYTQDQMLELWNFLTDRLLAN